LQLDAMLARCVA